MAKGEVIIRTRSNKKFVLRGELKDAGKQPHIDFVRHNDIGPADLVGVTQVWFKSDLGRKIVKFDEWDFSFHAQWGVTRVVLD